MRTSGLILQIFLSGILALVLLYLGIITDWFILKYVGYGLAGSFIFVFLFFLVDCWCVNYLEDHFIDSFQKIPFILFNSRVILSAVEIFLFILILLLLYKIILG